MPRVPVTLFIATWVWACGDSKGVVPDDSGHQCGSLTPGISEFTLAQEIDGDMVDRTVVVHAPEVVNEEFCYPVLFAFHGNGGTGQDWVSVLQEQVEAGLFVGVYPEGHLQGWNTGHEETTADDVAFAEGILAALVEMDGLDATAPVALGESNGGGLVHRLGMNSERFVGLAALSSPLNDSELPDDDDPPVSILQIQGTADDSIPYEGGTDVSGNVTFLGAEESAAVWAAHNNCEAEPTEETVDDRTTALLWRDCSAGVRVSHYRVEEGEHHLPDDIGGDTQALVWDFLSAAR